MPTAAKQPSLKSTQAIGAILLHQFTRQRFIEAGVDEEWIHDVEKRENLDYFTAALLKEEEEEKNVKEPVHMTSVEEKKVFGSKEDSSNFDTIRTTESEEPEQPSNISQILRSPAGDVFLDNNSSSNTITPDNVSIVRNSTAIIPNDPEPTIYLSINNEDDKLHEGRNVPLTTDSNSIERIQSSPMMAFYGQELRKIADEFEKTRLRQVVRQRANDIRLESISRETFMQLLKELFEGGITRERIVILFFFCTDVALRAVSFGQELVVKLIQWSFAYIIETVCKIIHMMGGWETEFSSANWQTIIFQQLPSILISCCAALGIVALASHLNKSLRA